MTSRNFHVLHLVKKNSFMTACGRHISRGVNNATSSLSEFMADKEHCKMCDEFAKKAIAKREGK